MPHVPCPSCGLHSYAVTPHSTRSLCPYCDAELFPAARRGAAGTPGAGAEDETAADLEAEAA